MFKKQLLQGFLLYALSLSVQAAIVVSINTDTPQVNTGDNISFTIDISGLDDNLSLSSYVLSVDFDPVLLKFDSVVFGDPLLGNQLDISGLGMGFGYASVGDNSVYLSEVSWDESTDLQAKQANDFILASLFFTALSSGASPLTLTLESLADSEANPLSADSQNSSVKISSVPLPSALWLFSGGFTFLVSRRFAVNI